MTVKSFFIFRLKLFAAHILGQLLGKPLSTVSWTGLHVVTQLSEQVERRETEVFFYVFDVFPYKILVDGYL